MSDEENPEPQPAAAPPAKRGGFMKLVLIALPVFVITLAVGWWFLGGSSKPVQAEEETRIEERGVVPLEQFLVNLSDPGGNRFLKVSLQLVFASEAEAKHVEGNAALMSHARSAILELLTEQKAQVLVTAEGKTMLKDALKAHLAKLLTRQKVVDVLFSEFVVQF